MFQDKKPTNKKSSGNRECSENCKNKNSQDVLITRGNLDKRDFTFLKIYRYTPTVSGSSWKMKWKHNVHFLRTFGAPSQSL